MEVKLKLSPSCLICCLGFIQNKEALEVFNSILNNEISNNEKSRIGYLLAVWAIWMHFRVCFGRWTSPELKLGLVASLYSRTMLDFLDPIPFIKNHKHGWLQLSCRSMCSIWCKVESKGKHHLFEHFVVFRLDILYPRNRNDWKGKKRGCLVLLALISAVLFSPEVVN